MKKIFKVFFILVAILLFATGCGEEPVDNSAKIVAEDELTVELKEEFSIDYSVINGQEASNGFSSSDEKVVKVDEFGDAVAKGTGEAIITITVNLFDGNVITKDIKVIVSTEYVVTFQLAGGSCSETSAKVKANETYILPIPTKENAEFIGWSISGVSGYVTEVSNLTSNIVVRANWLNHYFVKFELNGGTYKMETLEVKEGEPIEFGEPTKAGNEFLGWSLSKTSTSYITKLSSINANCTIYANWKPAKIDLNFDLDGGIYNGPRYVTYDSTLVLGVPQKPGYAFKGWTLEKGSTSYINKLENVTTSKNIYANWQESSSEKGVLINNLPFDGIEYLSSLQLTYEFYPSSLSGKKVSFATNDTSIISVSSTGLIETKKVGVATISVTVEGNPELNQTIEVEVFFPGRFEVSYETNSYVTVNDSINLKAKYIARNNTKPEITWKSLDSSIATVDSNGKVTGKKAGLVNIQAYVDDNTHFEFPVTVIDSTASDAVKFILSAHESNVFTRYNLPIGAGSPAYSSDIIGSVSDLLFDELQIDKTYYDKLPNGTKNSGPMTSVEFITVHYTGNMSKGADADNNVDYFNNLGYAASIHFVTGRSSLYGSGYDSYRAFAGLNEKYGAWHAGDGTSTPFKWYKTGVKWEEGDPLYPVFGISKNSKFTINGKETKNSVPTGTAGTATEKVTGDTFIYNGVATPCINEMGLPFRIVDGEYEIGTTYWCYNQIASGRICSHGGNLNSIGIESCVDEGSDLWHTWQVTAQLVASLMVKYNLDITRVVGHHFFTAKDCPQPMLENDKEIWWKFIEMVEAEYELITKFKDYNFKFEVVSGNGANNNVRAIQDPNTKVVTYKVTISNGTETETITLASALNGIYTK